MKLEVGMYARTKIGVIGEIISIDKNSHDNNIITIFNGNFHIIHNEIRQEFDITKVSHELMELVEPMDLMYIDISPDDCGGIVVPRVAETLNELEKWKERISSGECILKGVLTKEQINNNCYWVGE